MDSKVFSESLRYGLQRIQAFSKRAATLSGDAVQHYADNVVIVNVRIASNPTIAKRKQREGSKADAIYRHRAFNCDSFGLAHAMAEIVSGCPRWEDGKRAEDGAITERSARKKGRPPLGVRLSAIVPDADR